jgi:hypothetical protein
MSASKRSLFCKKAPQKTFINLPPKASHRHARESGYPRLPDCGVASTQDPRTKVFCGAFLQKSDLF